MQLLVVLVLKLVECWGVLIQKTLWGRVTNMDSKISLLVYEWPHIKHRIWYMNGLVFPNLCQNWLTFKNILEKSDNFAQNVAQYFTDRYMNGSLFIEKLVFVWSTFKFCDGMSLPKPNLSTPPPVEHTTFLVLIQVFLIFSILISFYAIIEMFVEDPKI